MKILVTGCDGYIGWPLIIKLCLDYPKAQIIGIDNLARRKWVKEVKSKSKLKIATMSERCKELKKFGVKNFKFINLDLTSYPKTDNLIKKFKPNFILHLAAQPSAPYANSNYKRSFYTSFNNNTATLNLLWSMKSNKLYDTIFVETTTTGVYGAPKFKIPEGQPISTEKWNDLKRKLAEKSGGNIEILSKIELYECKEYSEQEKII